MSAWIEWLGCGLSNFHRIASTHPESHQLATMVYRAGKMAGQKPTAGDSAL
jgi:hypothetical protein